MRAEGCGSTVPNAPQGHSPTVSLSKKHFHVSIQMPTGEAFLRFVFLQQNHPSCWLSVISWVGEPEIKFSLGEMTGGSTRLSRHPTCRSYTSPCVSAGGRGASAAPPAVLRHPDFLRGRSRNQRQVSILSLVCPFRHRPQATCENTVQLPRTFLKNT